jgi:hypothetical protein
MNDENKIVRWLLKGTRHNNEWADDEERDTPLTWEFVFWDNNVNEWTNPRPTLSWKNSNNWNGWY